MIQLPVLTKINKFLIITVVALFLIDSVLRQTSGFSISSFLALTVNSPSQGLIHTLFTYIFIPRGLMDVLFECLILWFLGSDLEQRWGNKRYIFYIVFVALISALFYLLAGSLMGGRSALQGLGVISSALCVSYAVLFPERQFTFMFLFPMKARIFCLLLAGITLYGALLGGGGASALALLCSMAMGYVALLVMANPLAKSWFDRTPEDGELRRRRSNLQKSHLKIVKDDDKKDPPTYH